MTICLFERQPPPSSKARLAWHLLLVVSLAPLGVCVRSPPLWGTSRTRAPSGALAPLPQKRSLFSWPPTGPCAPPNTSLPFSTTSLFFPIHIPSLLDLFLPWIPCTTSPFSALLPCPSLALLPHTSLAFSSHALFLRGSLTHTHPLLPNTHIPCLSPTHFLSLHSRLTRSSSLGVLPPLASQHTHPLLPNTHIPCPSAFSHTHPLPTFSSHTLFLPLLSNTHTLCCTQKLSSDDSGAEKKSRLSDPFSCRRTSQRLALDLWLPPTSNQRPNRGAPAS